MNIIKECRKRFRIVNANISPIVITNPGFYSGISNTTVEEFESWLTQKIAQVEKEIRESERERIKIKCEKYKKEQLADPWSFGMNIEMTNGYVRAMEELDNLEHGWKAVSWMMEGHNIVILVRSIVE